MHSFRQKTILVVEDEALIRFTIADALEDAGYLVLEAASVLDAVGKLGQYENIDLVLTDIDMPGGQSGIDLAKMIAECAPKISIVVSSGRNHRDLAGLPDVAHHLPKPCTAGALLSTVGGALKARDRAGIKVQRQSA